MSSEVGIITIGNNNIASTTISDLKLIDWSLSVYYAIQVYATQNATLNKIHFENVTFSQITSVRIIEFLYSKAFAMTNLTMKNVILDEVSSVIHLYGNQYSLVEMVELLNVSMHDSRIITSSRISDLIIQTIICQNVTKINPDDDRNVIVQYESQSSSETDHWIIKDLHSNFSNIALLKLK